MNTALLVFTENVDSYTLNQQLKSLKETYNIHDKDVYAIHAQESFNNLNSMVDLMKDSYQNLIYLTEDSDWLNFERDMKSEYDTLFESIKVLPRLAEQIVPIQPAQPQQTQVPPQGQQTPPQGQQVPPNTKDDVGADLIPNGIQNIVYFPYNAPYGEAINIAKSFKSKTSNSYFLLPAVKTNYSNKFQNDIGKDRFCSSPFMEEMVLKHVLGSNILTNITDMNPTSHDIARIKKYMKNNVVDLHFPKSEQQLAMQAFLTDGIRVRQIVPLADHNYSLNSTCYQNCLKVWSEIKDIKASVISNETKNKKDVEEMKTGAKTQKGNEEEIAKKQKELEKLIKKHPNKDPKEIEEIYQKQIQSQTEKTKEEQEKQIPIPAKAILIYGVIGEAVKFSSGKINESESSSSRNSKDDRLARMAKALGLDKDAAMAEEAANQAGGALIISAAKAMGEGLKGDLDDKKLAKKLGLTEDEIAQIRAMMENDTYKTKLEPTFGDF